MSLTDDVAKFRRDGFVVQHELLDANEVEALRDAAERVAQDIYADATRSDGSAAITMPDGHRIQFASQAAIQWEWLEGSRQIRIVEPIDHLDNAFAGLFEHPGLCAFAAAALEVDQVAPFTSKLNLKRAREGSRFPWHQDYPYWYVRIEEDAREVMTAVILLDDADAGNGALRVLPGSQRGGPFPRDPNDVLKSLADPARIDESEEVLLEAAAGSVIWFGSLLLHRSAPNLSDRDRRAILPSFQPFGRRHFRDTPFHPHLVEDLP
jgi:hypothetical protein